MDNRQVDGASAAAAGYSLVRAEPKKRLDTTQHQPNEITPRPTHVTAVHKVRRVKVDCGELFRSWAYPKN